MNDVTIDAPAKVNLRLKVLAQETSGYHSLETIFCAVSLADQIRLRRGGGDIRLTVVGEIDTGPEEDNLVVRAARRFYLALGDVGDGVEIELTKRIPAAAGLGGGSSDAAATLRALNTLHGDRFSGGELLQLGMALGSDVPFFLSGSPLALGWSRGERLLPVPALPVRSILIAHPGVPMPTSQAFQRIAELRGGGYEPVGFVLGRESLSSWESLAEIAENDFEAPAMERIPEIAGAKEAMLRAGAQIALLSGSGAALFGVFPTDAAASAASDVVRVHGFQTWTARTLEALPEPHFAAAPGR